MYVSMTPADLARADQLSADHYWSLYLYLGPLRGNYARLVKFMKPVGDPDSPSSTHVGETLRGNRDPSINLAGEVGRAVARMMVMDTGVHIGEIEASQVIRWIEAAKRMQTDKEFKRLVKGRKPDYCPTT